MIAVIVLFLHIISTGICINAFVDEFFMPINNFFSDLEDAYKIDISLLVSFGLMIIVAPYFLIYRFFNEIFRK